MWNYRISTDRVTLVIVDKIYEKMKFYKAYTLAILDMRLNSSYSRLGGALKRLKAHVENALNWQEGSINFSWIVDSWMLRLRIDRPSCLWHPSCAKRAGQRRCIA